MKVKKRMDKSGKKKVIIIILVVVLVILIALAGVFIYLKYKDNKLLESIKNHYGNSIEVVNDTKLYTKNKKAIGKAYEGLFLELDKNLLKIVKINILKLRILIIIYFIMMLNVLKLWLMRLLILSILYLIKI